MELSNKKINMSIRRKFIRPLNDGIKYNVNKLNVDRRVKYKETVSLLTQSSITINNVEKLLNSSCLIDANSLLRSSFEYILVAMMLQLEDNVYKEFIDLSIDDDKSRDFTKIQKLINKFKTHLDEISEDLFKEFNRKDKGKMLEDLYDKLCKFTHGSLFVSTIVEIKKKDEIEILKLLAYQNLYFVKVLLFCCLKYFTNDKEHYIYLDNMFFSFFLYSLQIASKMKNSEVNFEKYNEFLYMDKNQKYFEKNEKYNEKVQNEMISIKDDINNEKFIFSLKEFIK